jgi:carbonic anhydrase
MHTDCGCCLAWSKIDTIVHNISRSLDHEAFTRFKAQVGEPFRDNLLKLLEAFPDPRLAVQTEVERIRTADFIPSDVVVHGLLYHLSTGKLEVIVE